MQQTTFRIIGDVCRRRRIASVWLVLMMCSKFALASIPSPCKVNSHKTITQPQTKSSHQMHIMVMVCVSPDNISVCVYVYVRACVCVWVYLCCVCFLVFFSLFFVLTVERKMCHWLRVHRLVRAWKGKVEMCAGVWQPSQNWNASAKNRKSGTLQQMQERYGPRR